MDMSGGHTHGGHDHHAPGSHLSYMCDGTHWTGMAYQRPSNWSTHVIPGVLVTFWAIHWTVGVFKAYLTSSRSHPYRSKTIYDFPFIPTSWAAEGVLKVLVAFFSIMAQLWWSHGHWSRSICEDGTLRAGHFSITAVHNWQNAWTLFAFMVAGLVDVAAPHIVLPSNLQHFMTASAFALQAFGLYQGQHQDMLDLMVYYLMFMSVASTAVVMTAEMVLPDAFWLGCLKVFTLWLQAIWYFATARFLFEGRPAWDTLQPVPDMSPEMYAPVIFVMWMNMTAVGLLTAFLFLRWWFAAHLNENLRASCSVERTLVHVSGGGMRTPHKGAGASPGDGRGLANHELVPLVSRA